MHDRLWKTFSSAGVLLALSLGAAPAFAQWSGKGEAGMALASGNTDSKTANAKVVIARKLDAWELSAALAGQYVRSSGSTTARRWEVGTQARYSFSGDTFWYGGLRYEEDRFSGFDHQGVIDTGLGRRFIDRDGTKVSGQAGIGYKFLETVAAPPDQPDSKNSIAGVVKLDVEHSFNASTTAFNHFGGEFTSDNNFLQNDIGLAVKMSDRLALAVAYGVRHNTRPPTGFKKTDTLSTVNLVYEIK